MAVSMDTKKIKSDYQDEYFQACLCNFLNIVQSNIITSVKSKDSIHSIKTRIKDSQHLVDKIKRKNNENRHIDETNFKSEITDLIGIRILYLYSEQFINIHEEIISNSYWRVKEMKAYTWDPDAEKFYRALNIHTELKDSHYTSVHYVVCPNNDTENNINCEIQVRTLFEEIWGEIDHKLNYPKATKNISCKEQLRVLAKLVSTGTRLVDSIFKTRK